MASSTSPESSSAEGPVLSVLTKRLRALKKKLNRIHQMEQTLAQGKPLNAEQQEVLRSKSSLLVLIDELEKLRQPLSQALQDELSQHTQQQQQSHNHTENHSTDSLEDFVKLVYFGSLFDVKSQGEFNAMMLTRTHERECCLTYDYVTDESTELLGERDLDSISALGAMVTSRSRVSTVSHKNAIQECVEHAKLWLEGSEKPISPDLAITYAGLREKLRKIMASDYFTTTPEMRVPDDMAAAVEKYSAVSQVQLSDGSEEALPEEETEAVAEFQPEVEQEEREFQGIEHAPNDTPADEETKVEPDELNSAGETASALHEQQRHEEDFEELDERDLEPKEHNYNSRGSYQNQRGGYRGGSRGRRGGYVNGRGGRGGNRGGNGNYQNGNYYPRTYFNQRGRGGRSGGSGTYYNQGGGNYGSQAPAAVELGTGA